MSYATPKIAYQANPDGPAELADFDFAIGDWTNTTTITLKPNGEPDWEQPALPTGRWSFRYALNGWAVQDEFSQPLADGITMLAMSIRSFDKDAGMWRVRGVVTGFPGWDEFEVQRDGARVVMLGSSARVASQSGGTILERITFYDFQPNSWKRKGEQSSDGGKTWSAGAAFSLLQRVENK